MTIPSNLGGRDWVATQLTLQQWVVACTQLPSSNVSWAQQLGSPRMPEPAISMRLMTHATTGIPWMLVEDTPLVLAPLAVSAVSSGADTLTITAHGLQTGDGPIQFTTTGTLPAPLAVLTSYWVFVVDVNTIKLCNSFAQTGGTPFIGNVNPVTVIDLTTTGSGVQTLTSISATLRGGQEIQYSQQILERVTLTLECYTSVGVGMGMATALLHRVVSRQQLPSVRAILQNANIGITEVRNVRSINGRKDAVLWEPKALCDVYLNLPVSESEPGTIITTAVSQGTLAPTGTVITATSKIVPDP